MSEQIAERERQLLRREGYVAGAMTWGGYTKPEVVRAAEKRYPLPKVERPLRAVFSWLPGCLWWFDGLVMQWLDGDGDRGNESFRDFFDRPGPFTAEDFALLGRMLSGDTQLVEDDGSLLRDGGL